MRFVDSYFYKPNFLQKSLAILLLPLSLLYFILSILRRKLSKFQDFGIPIISVGNLIAGGSGKTPFIIATAKNYEKVAIITRGYKRKSKGLVVVSQWGKILVSAKEAGDEAYLIAKSLKNASIIACKNRIKAIEKAKEMGALCIFLDDGFRFNFKKLNILLKPKLEPYFRFCIPSGIYRENPNLYTQADLLIQEGKDYKRHVRLKNETQRMILLTAIANPSRLDSFLPNVIDKIYLPDHSDFNIQKLKKILEEKQATSLLVTQKDAVKLEDANLPLSILELELEISPFITEGIHQYIHKSI